MKVIKPPEKLEFNKTSVFLAGSIEMGSAIDWQTQVTNSLKNLDLIVLNPRRDDWDTSWKQEITNPQFHEQVTWELDALDKCDIIAMYFDPATKSPISLLELGLLAASGKLIVCCPEGFYRKGNVDIVCQRNNIPTVNTLDELIEEVMWRVGAFKKVQAFFGGQVKPELRQSMANLFLKIENLKS